MTYALPLNDPALACRLLAAAQSSRTDAAGQYHLADMVRAGVPFRVYDDENRPVAAYLLQPQGDALWIMAAAGRAAVDLVAVLCDLTTRQARIAGYAAVGFRTERRGLVRKATRHGFTITRQEDGQYFLRKRIT